MWKVEICVLQKLPKILTYKTFPFDNFPNSKAFDEIDDDNDERNKIFHALEFSMSRFFLRLHIVDILLWTVW